MERASPLSLMPASQQSAATDVGRGEALTLRAGSASVLRVSAGRLWVTPSSTAAQASRDVFLRAGEQLALAAGQEVVLEGWPSARFELIAAARPAAAGGTVQRLLRAVRSLSASSRTSAAPAPQCCS